MHILSEIEQHFSDNTDFLSLYASSCRRLGLLDKSKSLFEKAIALDDQSVFIRNNYANLLIDLLDYVQARVILEDIISIDSDYTDAVENLNRLSFLESKASLQPGKSTTSQSSFSLSDFNDPLLLAFGDDEVERSSKRYNLKKVPVGASTDFLPSPDSLKTSNDYIRLAEESVC